MAQSKQVLVLKHVSLCSHIFVLKPTTLTSFQLPYKGLLAVKKRTDKFLDIDVDQKIQHVSIDWLEPAFIISDSADMPEIALIQ